MENSTIETRVADSPTASKENQSVSLNKSQAIGICAAGLLICFFLPWINFLGFSMSGFDAASKFGGVHRLYWLVPIFSALTIFAVVTKRSPKIAAQLTGALPFCILAYAFSKFGQDLMKLLSIGAYIGLILGLVLFILPRRMK